MTDKVIVWNSARCLNCGDHIESKHRHDFVKCTCGNLSVDGGRDYLKRGVGCYGWEETSIMKEESND